jgi:hypothetical protein
MDITHGRWPVWEVLMIDTLRRPLLLATFLTLGGGGCVAELGGEEGDIVATDDTKDSAAVIVGSVDWVPVHTLAEGTAARDNARPVAYLALGGSRCTGFLIAPDVLMTNHHCVPSAQAAAGATAYFRYEDGVTDDVGVDCSTFIGNDAGLDFALLQCAGRPGDRFGTVALEARSARVGDRVYAIHQNCDYFTTPSCAPTKKFSAGAIRQLGEQLGHDADTLGGSSGSPVFSDASHAVIALHRAGRSTGNDGRGTMNFAVPMTRILPVLSSRYPGLTLGATTPATPVAPGVSTTDVFEPNDTRGGATLAARPFATTGARIERGDVDMFRVDDAVTLDVTLRFSHAAGDLDLAITDESGRQLAKSTGVGDVERVQGSFAGPVIVVVYGYNNAAGAYDLTVR